MVTDLKQHVIDEVSSERTQEMYVKKAEKGLWGSEEILIRKYFTPKSAILDIGCGTGRTTIPLHELGYDVTGIDIVPAMIDNAKKIGSSKNLDISYEQGDATNLSYEDGSFDHALFSFNGWTQIPGKNNRIRALQEIHRVLNNGGYFIFTAHMRRRKGFTWLWIKQWIKQYILKPLGVKIDEIDFGDRFFYREDGQETLHQKQYIHIPSFNEVKNQIAQAGFDLIFSEKSDLISDKETGEAPPTVFVCKKSEGPPLKITSDNTEYPAQQS